MVDNKEFRIDDIQLGNTIEIKVYDMGENPIVGERFSIVVDNGIPETMETNDEWIRKSAEEVLLQQLETAEKNLQHWASWNLSLSQVE